MVRNKKRASPVDTVLTLRLAVEAVKRARELAKEAGVSSRTEKALARVLSTVSSALRTADKHELRARAKITREQAREFVDDIEPELRRRLDLS